MFFFEMDTVFKHSLCKKKIKVFGGDYTEVVPPVPISNTEVKYLKANDSRFFPAKVGSHHQRS